MEQSAGHEPSKTGIELDKKKGRNEQNNSLRSRHPTISRPSSSFSALSTPIAHSLTCDSFSATVCVHSRFGSLCVTDRGCLLTLFTNRACPILAPSSSELHLNVCKQFTFANPRHACSCDFIAHSSSIPPSREINSADICTPMPASSLHARERTCPAALLTEIADFAEAQMGERKCLGSLREKERVGREPRQLITITPSLRLWHQLIVFTGSIGILSRQSLPRLSQLSPSHSPTAPNLTPCIVTFLAVCVCDCFLIVLSNGALPLSLNILDLAHSFVAPSTNWE
ncbi:hypothetical protein BLNAU_21865 [Blattamonas nauphoetae]|uniref:Uncharacterized protein n=1 Tax=Blattamonas nauphoetae TaxID=2049346 RepID=A0ABQ9WVT5_9EUKA|nr:hypothetical protein BLNAU_21865 [Blattamonas nauphoetae]